MQSAIIDVKAVSTPASNSSTDEVQGTGKNLNIEDFKLGMQVMSTENALC